MKEPADHSKTLLPLLAVIAIVIVLLGGLVGLVKRTIGSNEHVRYMQKQWYAPAAMSPEPKEREQGSTEFFIGTDSSRRME